MKKRKNYEELTFADNFMFCKILSTNKELLLGIKVKDISFPESEKVIEIVDNSRGIRLDVYADDQDGTVYDLEMQTGELENLPKRSRYYQSLIDLGVMERGSDFSDLNNSYVIFICLDDPFDQNLPKYTFENRCFENSSLKLNDGAVKVFVNAKGACEDADEELKEFLNFLLNRGIPKEGSVASKIAKAVEEARAHKRWREEYKSMINVLDFERREARREGLEEGRAEGRELGLEEGRTEGRAEEATLVYRRCIERGMSEEDAVAISGVSRDVIDSILI